MFKIIFTSLFTVTISFYADAQVHSELYTSVARDKKGAETYQERHEVTFRDRRVQKAKTRYYGPQGQLIGEMTSNFTKKVTVPEYEYKDLRTRTSHGINLDGDKMTLWYKNEKGEIESSDFYQNKFSQETLLVGCQGLHYYLIDNLEQVKERKKIPIAYFIPGKLDYFKFTLKLDREDEKYIYLKLSIDNLFLRLFTSSLDLKYSKSDRRLVRFSGLSNITDDKNEMQNVVIDYKYD